MMRARALSLNINSRLAEMPAVVLLGPRQVGKTTLALQLSESRPSIYLDLESEADRLKLAEPELYLAQHAHQLVILDEVQRAPRLFETLRGLIDKGRHKGLKTGRFLLLGSASLDLMRQSTESLAGRASYLELTPLAAHEVQPTEQDVLWLRGGFPDGFLAKSDASSHRWRMDFIRTYLERDVPQLGVRIPAETLRRFWTMLAHRQGSLLNASALGVAMGVDSKTAANYLDLLVGLLLVRRLPPWHANTGKRLVKSPKIYVRDSGLVHALLGIANTEALLSHPICGLSWEGGVIESLIAAAPQDTQAYFYRTAAGAEIDLLLVLPDGKLWAIEIKRSLAPKLSKGFHLACADLTPAERWVAYAGQEQFAVAADARAISPPALASLLQAYGAR